MHFTCTQCKYGDFVLRRFKTCAASFQTSFGNGTRILLRLRSTVPNGSPMRCQPVLRQIGTARSSPSELPFLPPRQGTARSAETLNRRSKRNNSHGIFSYFFIPFLKSHVGARHSLFNGATGS